MNAAATNAVKYLRAELWEYLKNQRIDTKRLFKIPKVVHVLHWKTGSEKEWKFTSTGRQKEITFKHKQLATTTFIAHEYVTPRDNKQPYVTFFVFVDKCRVYDLHHTSCLLTYYTFSSEGEVEREEEEDEEDSDSDDSVSHVSASVSSSSSSHETDNEEEEEDQERPNKRTRMDILIAQIQLAFDNLREVMDEEERPRTRKRTIVYSPSSSGDSFIAKEDDDVSSLERTYDDEEDDDDDPRPQAQETDSPGYFTRDQERRIKEKKDEFRSTASI